MSDETKTTTIPDAAQPATAETAAPAPIPSPPPPPPRARAQIQVDYTNACAQLGELRFQRECIRQTEVVIMNRINALRQEEAALPPEAKKAPPHKMAIVPPTDDGT